MTIIMYYKIPNKEDDYDYKTCGEQLLFTYDNEKVLDNKLYLVVQRVRTILDHTLLIWIRLSLLI